jgi:hypothetical protein
MKKKSSFYSIFLILSTLIGGALFVTVKGVEVTELLQPYGMTIAMLLVLISVQKTFYYEETRKSQELICSLAYLCSILMINLFPENRLFNWWMVAGVIAALYFNAYIGVAVHGILTYLLCSLYGYTRESFIFYALIGVIICILSRYMTNLASFLYVLVIALSSNFTLTLVLHNYIWSEAVGENTVYSLISTGVVVLVAYLFWKRDGAEEKEGRLEEILLESFPLRQRLLEYSEGLYQHSLHISSVATRAAAFIGCNEKLVQAGGLYHEIGRIQGKDYIEEGVKLGEEYRLPKRVIEIIRQHNAKYEKPGSVEAAVVMLTDSIVSTIEYMEKEQPKKEARISAEKIIDQIFDVRLAKGTLDESGMDIRSYKRLKEFFKDEYSKEKTDDNTNREGNESAAGI